MVGFPFSSRRAVGTERLNKRCEWSKSKSTEHDTLKRAEIFRQNEQRPTQAKCDMPYTIRITNDEHKNSETKSK